MTSTMPYAIRLLDINSLSRLRVPAKHIYVSGLLRYEYKSYHPERPCCS